MVEGEIYIPAHLFMPKEDGIYAVKRIIRGYLVKDIVWRKGKSWISMDGHPIPGDNVKAWEYKE